MTEKFDPKDARQGRSGTQVFKVLMYALAACAIAWIVLELIWK